MKLYERFTRLFLIPLVAAVSVHAADTRPNILIILVDDMGYADTQPYGSEIQTPNLMKLAESGLRFTDFHNCAKCSPTRGALMTGLYPQQAGMAVLPKAALKAKNSAHVEGTGELNKQAVTLAEVMKSAGYATYMSGKWHLSAKENAKEATTDAYRSGWPCQRGFDRFFGFLPGITRYFNSVTLVSDNAPVAAPAGSYVTDLFAEHASGFITDHAKSQPDKPFFMYLAFNAPHWQVTAKPEDVAAYKGVYDLGWDALREQRLAKQKELGVIPSTCVLSPRNDEVSAWDSLKPEQKTECALAMATYAGMITCLDRGIGRVMATLEAVKLRDNTLVVFLSDNGACAQGETSMKMAKGGSHPEGRIGPGWANAGNTPFRYWKNTTWQGGTATPLIVNWPKGVAPSLQGKVNTQDMGHVVDFMPTCVELAHASYPTTFKGNTVAPMEGRSLVPIFQGQPLGDREQFWQYGAYDSVRSGSWKMTRQSGGDWMLFDLSQDPSELKDLAKSNPEKVATLSTQWKEWATRVGAALEGAKDGKKK